MAPESKHLGTVPDLNTLRQDAMIQFNVEERLKQLQESDKPGKIKSLRGGGGGAVEVLVQNKVKWPHEYVLSGSNKERVSYDHLSILQWVAGGWLLLHYEGRKKFGFQRFYVRLFGFTLG